jgi:hypothetical protein
MKKNLSHFAVIAGLFFLAACQKSIRNELQTAPSTATLENANPELKYNTFKGPDVPMGAGVARSWITINHAGVPSEIGVELTDEVLYNLPDTNFSVAIPMHLKAKQTTPFDHLYITWSSHGHPLPGTFISPHMDVRFYMMSLEDQLAIPAPPSAQLSNLPPAGFMPDTYFPDAPVGKIGLHWTDKTFSNPVTSEMILGTFDGKFSFVSPIMVLGVLQSGESISLPYDQPENFAKTNTYYPTKYNVYRDNITNKHHITLSDFVLR